MRWRDEASEPHANDTNDNGAEAAAAAQHRTSSLDDDEADDHDGGVADSSSGSPDLRSSSSCSGGGSPGDKARHPHPHRRLEGATQDGGDGTDGAADFPSASAAAASSAASSSDQEVQHKEMKEETDPPDKDSRSSSSGGGGGGAEYGDGDGGDGDGGGGSGGGGGGGDHAEEEPPGVPWTPQTVQSTCEFTHTIANYAQQRESGCKKAEYSETTVDEFGNRWRLIIYVNGNGRASNHHLSLFLQVADADDLPFGWKKAVSYVLTLEHPKGGSFSYAKRNPDKTFKLCPKAIDWGWSQFITSDRIQQEGFVANDSLTVRASVTVKSSSVSIEEEDAELYLKCAVEEGDAASVKLCLDQGASVNCKFKDDLYTPLHTACSSGTSKGSIDVLNLLLVEGADPNACNKWRETPLLIAANNGHLAACEALLEHGADPSLCSEAGWSALTFAAHKGYDDIVKILLQKGAPVNTRVAEDNSTPLHKACAGSKTGHQTSVKLLIEGNADVHALNKWRETPLLTAANHGQATSVKLLLDAGADPCKCTDTGWSPLSIAAYKGHDEVVRLLLEEGAPTEEEDPTLSALLQAATKGLPETVELLLRNGADHTVTTKKGDTALSILVEQNLIDAAVDMVTVYNASIPRCSRDRKKVQRARLLINLRMKQLERESKNHSGSTDEDESDDDGSHGSHSSQNLEEEGTESKLKQKKKREDAAEAANGMTAEAIARAAEEALLRELELEAAKARKDEAEANSKRAKKKKKKEQHRQQKIKEEEDRRQRELEEAEERERILKEKEEKKRKEQEAREQEKREREIKELMERQKVLVAKKKERERRERVQLKQREKDGSTTSPTSSDTSDKYGKTPKPQVSGFDVEKSVDTEQISTPKKNSPSGGRKGAPLAGNRRWETKQKSPTRPQSSSVVSPQIQEASTLPSVVANRAKDSAVPSTVLSPRPQAGEPSSSEPPNGYGSRHSPESVFSGNDVASVSSVVSPSVEHPAVSVFRREKVFELVRRCSDSMNIDTTIVKRAFYRWIVRAAHDTTPFVDPLIPSWKDINQLAAFFQRQFIADQRRGLSSSAVGSNIEVLKEAGTSVALLCQGLANEVEQFRLRIEENVLPDWTDASVETNCQEMISRDGLPVVSLSWKSRYEVHVPASTFSSLRERYRGLSNRLLTTIFVTRIWYETRDFVAANTGLDLRLPKETQARLALEAGVTKEIWGDPFSVCDRNGFSGGFESLDSNFGGDAPFGKYELSLNDSLVREGGSISVLPPVDNMVASMYIRRILDSLEAADRQGVPLSAAIFLPHECFPDLPSGPTPDDLKHIDPRLSEPRRFALSVVETLPASQHGYSASGSPGGMIVSHHQSLFLLLQNVAGKPSFPVSGASLRSILEPMLVVSVRRENPVVTPLVFPSDFGVRETPRTPPQSVFLGGMAQVSPDPQRIVPSELGTMAVPSMAKSFAPVSFDNHRSSRHGRLFDLVDDVEDDPLNDVDLVSGMLNNLDVGLFQNGNVAPDIDIEAISLMGIGGPTSQAPLTGNVPRHRFG